MRWLPVVVAVVVIGAGCAGPVPSAGGGPEVGSSGTVTVTRVIDGDTVEVRFAGGETDTLRLLGVDTPETELGRVEPGEFEGVPSTPAGRDHLAAWGHRATAFTREALAGETVRIATDPVADRRDAYGRLLVYVSVDGEDFNRRLLEAGYARLYESPFSRLEDYAAIEASARRDGVGLWGFDGATSPTPVADSTPAGVPTPPVDGDYDCGDFESHAQAQFVLEHTPGNPHDLDADGDGVACESLA